MNDLAHSTPPSEWNTGRCTRSLIAACCIMYLLVLCCWTKDAGGDGGGIQSLDALLDEDAYLNGLVELRLPEALDAYAATIASNDEIRQVKVSIARERLAAVDPKMSAEDRLAAMERSLVLRGKLIAAHEDHMERSTWLGDQAAALYFEMWPVDAAGLTTLFGVATEAERARAERVASQMYSLTNQAMVAVERAIIILRSSQDFAINDLKQERVRRLAEQERDRRLAFLLGVGAVLHAELSHDAMPQHERERLYRTAIETLLPLELRLGGRLINISLVHAALAHARLGEFDAAEAILHRVASDSSTHEGEVFLARMVGVINREVRDGPSAGLTAIESIAGKYTTAESVFFRVLLAEHRFLLLRGIASSQSGSLRQQTMRAAYAALTDLLHADTGVPRQTMRAIVYGKLSTATQGETVSLPDEPPIVALARAENQIASGGNFAEAIERLRDLISRSDTDDSLRGEAQFTLANALHASGDSLGAAAAFLELARRQPTHERAAKAMTVGIALAARHRAAGDATALFDDAMQLMLERFSHLPELDEWLYTSGRFELAAERWSAAIARFSRITPDAPKWPDALFMQTLTLKRQADAASSPDERRQLLKDFEKLAGRLRPQLSNRVDAERDAARAKELRHYRDTMRVFEADALLELNDLSRVVPILNGIELTPQQDPALIAQALRLRIEAYERLGRPADARREMEQFMNAAPEQFVRVALPMLQSLLKDVESLLNAGDASRAADAARRDAVPLARLAWQWVRDNSPDEAGAKALQAKIADALRLGGEFNDALQLYDGMLLRSPDAMELLLGRAECLYAIGAGANASSPGSGSEQLANAMLIYRRIANAVTDTSSHAYWQSQLRMLQILDKTGQNTDKIRPRIEQLRRRDPAFGGARYNRWFVELQNKHS